MADFKAGDRVVKMSGAAAGKYGTVNSVREDGTLNVTFDGERLPRYCDPDRCGQVAANAVEFTNPNYRPEAGMKFLDENFSMFDPKVAKAMIEDARRKGVKVPPGVIEKARRAGLIANAARNAVARNAAPSAQLKRAYDEWKKAAEKFKKWFGAGRRLSARVPDSADETRRMVEFSNLFFKETGRRPPNGYGEMTLEQMLASNSQKGVRNAVARNGDYDIEKFEVGKVYRAPWDRDWLAKVLSRTPSSIKVAIKSARDKTWHGADEQVTLRINPRKSEEQGAEVAKGWDWEFWADVKA